MKKPLLLILLFVLPASVAVGQQSAAILKIVVDEKGTMQVLDLRQDSLQKSQQGTPGADLKAILQEGNSQAGGEADLDIWQNSQDPEAVADRKKLLEKGLLQQGQAGGATPNWENMQDPEIIQLRQKLEQSEIKGGAQSQDKKPDAAEQRSEQSPAPGNLQANFASAFELIADSVYLRTGGESGPIVNNPVAGQQYFVHFDWRNTGDTAGNFRIEIKLNGEVFCAYNSGTIPANSPSTTYCTTPITWLPGSNTIEGVLDVNNVISEVNENNNRKRRIYPPPGKYELVADRMYLRTGGESGPEVDHPVAGQQYFIHFDWRNTGITASYFRIAIKLNGNVFCAYNNSGVIPGNSPSTTYCTTPVIWPAGTNMIEGIVDESDLIPEINEDNNGVSRAFPATPTTVKNLTFDFNKTTWSFNTGTRILSLTTRVMNNGTETAGSSELGYYLSTNATIDTSDFLIGTDAVESLAPGAFSDESFSADLCRIKGLTTPGTYFIGWYADHTFLIPESNEDDNAAVSLLNGKPASIVVTCPPDLPNLVLNFAHTTWNYNSSTHILSLTARVLNNGIANAGSSELGYYLSTNATITTSDFLIGTDFVENLPPGGLDDESFSADLCKINGLATPGTYFVGWYADHTFLIAESNENDNTAVSTAGGYPVSISVMCIPPLPNLTIDPSSSGNFNTATCDLYINAKVCNTGNANAGPSKVGYFLSSDAVISTSDCLVGDDATPILAPGACRVFTPTLNLRKVSCIAFPGTYYFGMIADYLKAVAESDENDNAAVFKPALNLTCPPECVAVARVECPSNVQEAAQFTVTVLVNMGSCPAPNHRLGSFSSKLAWNPSLISFVNHSGLQSGFTGVVNTSHVGTGVLEFTGDHASGAGGDVKLIFVTFKVVGASGKNGLLDLSFSAITAAISMTNLLPNLKIDDCSFQIVPGGICGDLNDDKIVNSTDALILLSYDVGISLPPAFRARINQGCGDLNKDGLTNSTDALICLTCDARLPQCPSQVGKPGCCK